MTIDSGIGERGFYAAAMAGEAPIVFHKQGKNVQLMVKNTRFHADNGPMSRAVARSFSDSILGITKIESLPHPERKSILIDLGAFMLTDLPMLSYDLEATFRIPYRFDLKEQRLRHSQRRSRKTSRSKRSRITQPNVRRCRRCWRPANRRRRCLRRRVIFPTCAACFSICVTASASGRKQVIVRDSQTLASATSSIRSRTTATTTATPPRSASINRWHLEKQDPSAALSPPKQPIVYLAGEYDPGEVSRCDPRRRADVE